MKRYIKFRGKRIDNGEWVYGGYSMAEEDDGTLYVFILDCCSTAKFTDEDTEFTGHRIKPRTLGQFTGLKDKKGVDIYEGDIFHLGEKRILYTVVWHDTGLRGGQNGTLSFVGLNHWQEQIEIVGNIYDSPELLKDK